MSNFDDHDAAGRWASEALARQAGGIFGKLTPAVIWSDARDAEGALVVPVDPAALVASINKRPHPLLHNHDPGYPKGQVLEAASFETAAGETFVMAIVGYYAGGDVLGFAALGVQADPEVPSPAVLAHLSPDVWIEIATDPREVDAAWVDAVMRDAPLPVRRTDLSHNAAESAQELIRIGLVYLAVVWNPFVTAIANEAGKDTYRAVHAWLRKLLEKLGERRDPILDIHTHQDGCQVSFLLRGTQVQRHYIAHDALPAAAAQAAQLVGRMKARGVPALQLVYEFDLPSSCWYPSYAVLKDGRIVTEKAALIAIENLPAGLSLGLGPKG